MSVKVSVCVTAYNRMALLDRTLESLARQTRKPDELIVSDDCSPQDPKTIVDKWRSCFPIVHYCRNERNLGMPGNLNHAIGLANGDYVVNLHDGDFYHPTLLQKWESALDSRPGAGLVFSGFGIARTERASVERPDEVLLDNLDSLTPGKVFLKRHMLHKYGSMIWGTVMARRAAYAKLLPFDPAFGAVSDVDMWMRMCMNFDIAYIREPLMILDYTSRTTNRLSRQFNWKNIETIWTIQLTNIYRWFSDPEELAHELRLHRRAVSKFYFRMLLGCLRRLKGRNFQEGLASWQRTASKARDPFSSSIVATSASPRTSS